MSHNILTFASIHQVIKADKLLSAAGIICRIIPVPESISSECGMCIETDSINRQQIEEVLQQNMVNYHSTIINH
jgi:hypothetical protein